MDNDLSERLRKIAIEDNFFVLFIFLIVLAFIANNYEKDYFMYKEDDDRKKYYYLQIFIFSMVVIVNVYYVYVNYLDKIKFESNSNEKLQKFNGLNLIASVFVLIAGCIFLYIAINDVDIDAEISL